MRILHKIIVLSLFAPGVFAASGAPNLTDGAVPAPAPVSAAPATQDNPLADLAVSQASNGGGSQSSESATVVASPLSTVSPGVPMNNSNVIWGFLVDPAKQAEMEAAAASRESSLKHLGSKSKKASSRDVPGPPYVAPAGVTPAATASASARAPLNTGGLIPDKSLEAHSLSASIGAAAGASSASANGLLPAAALAAAYPLTAASAAGSLDTPSEMADTAATFPAAGAGASTAKPAVVPASLPPVSESDLISLPAARAGAAVAERRLSAFPIGAQPVGVTARA